VAQGFDPAAAREQVAREIGRWNELGRSLAGALVAVAAERTGAEALPARA
jgi:hypothetical protein